MRNSKYVRSETGGDAMRFRASHAFIAQAVIGLRLGALPRSFDDYPLEKWPIKEPYLMAHGTKLSYRGGGWWIWYGYSPADRWVMEMVRSFWQQYYGRVS